MAVGLAYDETNKSQILSINQELNEIFAGFRITSLAQINNNIYISWAWVNE